MGLEKSLAWLPPEDPKQSRKCGQEKDSTLEYWETMLSGRICGNFSGQQNKQTRDTNKIRNCYQKVCSGKVRIN